MTLSPSVSMAHTWSSAATWATLMPAGKVIFTGVGLHGPAHDATDASVDDGTASCAKSSPPQHHNVPSESTAHALLPPDETSTTVGLLRPVRRSHVPVAPSLPEIASPTLPSLPPPSLEFAVLGSSPTQALIAAGAHADRQNASKSSRFG